MLHHGMPRTRSDCKPHLFLVMSVHLFEWGAEKPKHGVGTPKKASRTGTDKSAGWYEVRVCFGEASVSFCFLIESWVDALMELNSKVLCMTNTGHLQEWNSSHPNGRLAITQKRGQLPPALTHTVRSSQLVRRHPVLRPQSMESPVVRRFLLDSLAC